jgi:N-acetylneuraminate synthase
MAQPFIIAEIGINHNGDLDIAKRLIEVAKRTGCDAVKFQKRDIEIVYTKEFLEGIRESPWGNTQADQKNGLEFGLAEYKEIADFCQQTGILWSASAWDQNSLSFLDDFNLSFNKIASAMVSNQKFLSAVAERRKHTYISTGMSTYEMLDEAVAIFSNKGCPFELMHCVSLYPCDDDECNLMQIPELCARYQVPVGYSGHEKGIIPSVIAASLGATAIERHITLDRTMYGSDQAASLEEEGLRRLVRDSQNVRAILGSGGKELGPEEKEVAKKLRYWE